MSVDVTLKWYGSEWLKIYEDATKSGLEACAIDLQGQAKYNLKKFPRVDTGRLWQSVGYKTWNRQDNDALDGVRSNPKEFEAIVGTSVEYAAYVEYGTGIYAIGGRQTPWKYFDEKDGKFHVTRGMRMCPFLRLAKDMRAPFLSGIFSRQVIKYVASKTVGKK